MGRPPKNISSVSNNGAGSDQLSNIESDNADFDSDGLGDGIARASRGTGRASTAAEILDPAALGGGSNSGDDTAEPARKKRGRKPGSVNKPRSTTKAETASLADTIKDALIGIHSSLYALTSVPEANIEEDEAARVAQKSAVLASYYWDTEVPAKYTAWFNFVFAVGSVYGTRFALYKARLAFEKEARKSNNTSQPRQQFQGMPFAMGA